MKSRNLLLIVLASVVVAVFFWYSHRAIPSPSTQVEHALAPDFSLPNISGGQLTLSSYRGKVVLLDFWATWCTPCREEIPRFVQLQNDYGPHGLEIIGVSMDDSPDPVRDFYQHFHMNYPVVMGNAKTGELYGGILGLPIAFVLDREGHISSKHIGAADLSALENEIVKLLQSENLPTR